MLDLADCSEGTPHRVGAIGTAGDDRGHPAQNQLGLIGAIRRHRHHDGVDDA